MSEKTFAVILDRATVERLNRLGEFVRQAAVTVLNESPERVPLCPI